MTQSWNNILLVTKTMVHLTKQNMDPDEASREKTSWGTPELQVDARALRRYHNILSYTSGLGEILIFLLVIGIFMSVLWLITQANFENIIFYDGTDMTCILHGSTGNIKPCLIKKNTANCPKIQ